MSVRKSDRSESKLEVLNKAKDLADYTIRICRNEKVFPKSCRWIMSQRIVNECLDAITCIRRANATYIADGNKQSFEYRIMQQTQAHAHIDALLTLIDIAFNVYDIEGRRIEYWTGLAVETDDALKAWMKADKERFKKYMG